MKLFSHIPNVKKEFRLHLLRVGHHVNLRLCSIRGHPNDTSVDLQQELSALQLLRGQLQLREQRQLQNQLHHSLLQLASLDMRRPSSANYIGQN
jgi:hypothetical protein